ncbi:putative ATPase/DNA-binding CsgD family transcriptional regulator [Nocardia transvalensis]|uniref:Putative ATPase/DNA-binding CsgD family transcriptional regulator n=1 Tax=Nocardia transvalensis TaxID=37333 RepID=A0A7W9P868_9NOCA|nr:AAA family ATPase [Nocardia transvalensis]MBB5911210.1 putative ATPase/DNA-binding CsgD family transcriptional regulator [Nocardia transvalensis]
MRPHRPGFGGTLSTTADEFIGRERELEQITELLLGSVRLLTVTGSGGIGKTRLVGEATQRFHRARNAPVRWVRLARLPRDADPAEIEDEVARSVIDTDFSGRSARRTLLDTLDRRTRTGRAMQTVLIMDNCEHLLAGASAVITDLLDAVPGLSVIATSREPLEWADERLITVPPLTRRQALDLFRRRAELTGHTIGNDQAAVAEEICEHLHNCPLHIRLAAARLRRQPLSMIAGDLTGAATDRRLRWPTVTRGGVDERHRGIADVIAWSFDLCTGAERLLFERMSVFATGFDANPDDADGGSVPDTGADLEAIETICSGPDPTGADLDPGDIEILLERLADQSLILTHMTAETVRYSLLESFRVFARDRLSERAPGDPQRLADRHRRYYRDKITAAAGGWFSDRERQLLAWARAAWDNLLIAIDGSLVTPTEAVVGLEIATAMTALRVPFFKGSLRESRRWTERTLEATRRADPEPTELQIAAMASAAWIGMCQGLPDQAESMLERCIAACLPEPGAAAAWRADPIATAEMPAPVEFATGSALLLLDRDDRALSVFARAREKFTAAADSGSAAMSELFEALAAAFLGDAGQALEVTGRHLGNATRSGAEWAKSWAELAWMIAHTKHGDPAEALATGHAALTRQIAMRDSWGTTWAVHTRAWALARIPATAGPKSRSAETAVETARLLGGAAALRRELGVDIAHLGPFAAENDEATAVTRKALGRTRFDAAWNEGAALRPPLTRVPQLALGAAPKQRVNDDRVPRAGRPEPWQHLSAAERDVALLAASGWPNSAIAARRGSSHRTVDAQMASILRKLMISSRDDIGPLVPDAHRGRIARGRDA